MKSCNNFYFCTWQLEIGEGDSLSEEYLLDEIHPKKNLHRPKFAKPKGPANRGAKRLTKSPKDGETPNLWSSKLFCCISRESL